MYSFLSIAKKDISINIFKRNTYLNNCSLNFKYCFLRFGLKSKWLTSNFVHLVTQRPFEALNYRTSLRIWCKDKMHTSQGHRLLPFLVLWLNVPPFLLALWDHKRETIVSSCSSLLCIAFFFFLNDPCSDFSLYWSFIWSFKLLFEWFLSSCEWYYIICGVE